MTARGIARRCAVAVTAVAGAAALCLAVAAQAQPPIERPVGGLIARHAARLGLEGDSLRAVQAVIDASGVRHAELLAKLDAGRDRMRELLSQPVPDADAVMAQADVLGGLETQLHKNRLKAILDIRALLTPAQREALLKVLAEERAARDAERKECGPGGPPGDPPPAEPPL